MRPSRRHSHCIHRQVHASRDASRSDASHSFSNSAIPEDGRLWKLRHLLQPCGCVTDMVAVLLACLALRGNANEAMVRTVLEGEVNGLVSLQRLQIGTAHSTAASVQLVHSKGNTECH